MKAGIVLWLLGGVCYAIALLILAADGRFGPFFFFLVVVEILWVAALVREVRKRRR